MLTNALLLGLLAAVPDADQDAADRSAAATAAATAATTVPDQSTVRHKEALASEEERTIDGNG